MAQVTHEAPFDGDEVTGLTDGTRYTIECTGSYPVLLFELAAKPTEIDEKDAFWLPPRPIFPVPSRKIHHPGSRVIKKVAGLNFYVFGQNGDSTVVTAEAP